MSTSASRSGTDELLARLCCPVCKRELAPAGSALQCGPCGRAYPVVLGIPDLRVYPDPYISFADDHRKGERLQARADSASFAELVRYYWEITPETPPDLKERFIHHVLTDEDRVAAWLNQVPPGVRGRVLEVGCGTGAFLRVASNRFQTRIGSDIAFRWLVVARKRLLEAGLQANLVCCCADSLPFSQASFDSVVALSVLEHLPGRQAASVQEWRRVLQMNGTLWAVSTNRLSLAREPHVGLWGVGFLPRKWMPAYVQWRRGLKYDKYRLLSRLEFARLLAASRFRQSRFFLPPILPVDLANRTWRERASARLYQVLARIPVLRWALTSLAPTIQVVARRES